MADVWVGGETGILKGVDLNKKTYQNYGDIANAEKEVDEICRMCWFDDEERKICMGIRSGVCKIFDVEVGDFIDERKCFDQSDGRIVGLDRNERALMVCCENGIMRIFHDSSEAKTDVKVGSHVARMRINPFEKCQVATGGNENVLKLWDLNRPEKPLFKAKNVRNDHLDLQVPEYVKDIAFLSSPGSLPRIIVANIYHKLRVYDPEAQRRPVLDFSYEDSPITCVALPSHERFVVVGNALGEMAAIDIRNGKNLGSFKFFSGTINDIYCHRSEPLVASCGLDRFLRVHHMESRKLVNKIYMKSRLNSVLFSKNAKKSGEKANLGKRKQDEEIGDECDGDEDDIWRNMSVVKDDVIEKKTKPSGGNEDREG